MQVECYTVSTYILNVPDDKMRNSFCYEKSNNKNDVKNAIFSCQSSNRVFDSNFPNALIL